MLRLGDSASARLQLAVELGKQDGHPVSQTKTYPMALGKLVGGFKYGACKQGFWGITKTYIYIIYHPNVSIRKKTRKRYANPFLDVCGRLEVIASPMDHPIIQRTYETSTNPRSLCQINSKYPENPRKVQHIQSKSTIKRVFPPVFSAVFVLFSGHRMVRPNGRDEESPELERLLALGKTFQKPRFMWTDFPWRNQLRDTNS